MLGGVYIVLNNIPCFDLCIGYKYCIEITRFDFIVEIHDSNDVPVISGTRANMSPTTSASGSTSSACPEQCGDRQFVVLVSEKQARVVALPSQNCVYRQQLADTAFVVKAEIISLKGIILSCTGGGLSYSIVVTLIQY
jgi:hypothetical protein